MALTIETGAGVDGADSLVTLTEFAGHCTSYFGAELDKTDVLKEAGLRRAFIAMSGLEWSAGLWPTFGGTIPDAVKLAQSVLARVEVLKPLSLSPSVTTSGRKVLTEAKGIKWSTVGDQNTVEGSRPVVTMAMDLLRPYLAFDPSKDRAVGFGMMSVGP